MPTVLSCCANLAYLARAPEPTCNYIPGTILPASKRPTTPPNKFVSPAHSSPKSRSEVEEIIEGFIPHLESTIEACLRNDVQLPPWKPRHVSGEIRSQIENLKIPLSFTICPYPSLLLHDLGGQSHDPQLADRLSRLFDAEPKLKYMFRGLHSKICR